MSAGPTNPGPMNPGLETERGLRAAEYVLGTLSFDERAAFELERVVDPATAHAVAEWEERLGPLALAVPAETPPDHVWPGIAGALARAAAPGAAGAMMVESIVRDQKRIIPSCVLLEGEYGQSDICLGVPVVLGRNGWEEIIDYKLTDDEQAAFNKSADAVRSMNGVLSTLDMGV